jgi:hypothetical protein
MEGDRPDKYKALCAAVAKRVYDGNGKVKRIWEEAESADPEPLKVDDEVEILDGANTPNYAGGWYESMNTYIGFKSKVTHAWGDGTRVHLKGGSVLTFDYRGLKKIRKKG